MKQRFLSVSLALCLCISSQSVIHASREDPQQQEDIRTEADGSVNSDEEILEVDGEGAGPMERSTGTPRSDTVIPTQTQAYEAMIALKDNPKYAEGVSWTNEYNPVTGAGDYSWHGGTFNGVNIIGAGCVAFAFMLSDEAFGSLQNRMYAAGGFKYEDIKVGDILRMNNDAHTVIVLEVSDAGVVVAEGNYHENNGGGKVHWGRAISKEEVMRGTSHYITRYPDGYVAPDDPTVNDIIREGDFDQLTWKLTKAGTLTISGAGAMMDLSSAGEQPWNEESSQIRKVVIENGVTSIGACAFWNSGVLSAEIPSSVTTIGNSAFRGSSIISVTIPSSVKTIGDSAFRECQNLNSVTVSEGLETIVQNAFRSCTSLTSITLPASIGEVGAGAFFQCQKMISATFASGSKTVKMGDNMFTQCYNLMSVTLPQSIDRIGEGMFQNCGMLPGVEIPQGAESIGGSAFASCSSFTTVVIPDSVTTIGIAAFSKCALTDIYFTGTEAQWNSVSKIGDTEAALKNVTVHYEYEPSPNPTSTPSGSPTPAPSESPAPSPSGSPSPTSVPSGSPTPVPSVSPVPSPSESPSPLPTSSPSLSEGKTFTSSKVTYQVTKSGKEVELKKIRSTSSKMTVNTVTGTDGVEYKVTSIAPNAMKDNKKLKNLTIGDNVKHIKANAFAGCTNLKTVNIGGTSRSDLTRIRKNAFNGCEKLSKVTIKSTKLRSVEEKAFKGTRSDLKVKVPSKQLTKYRKMLKNAGLKAKQVTK